MVINLKPTNTAKRTLKRSSMAGNVVRARQHVGENNQTSGDYMPKKNKLYQCPYELQCKCDLTEPCLGCETWAEHYGKFNNSYQHTQPVIALLTDMREYLKNDTCQYGIGVYNRINVVLDKLQASS